MTSRLALIATAAAALLAGAAQAEDAAPSPAPPPPSGPDVRRIPTPDGEVILVGPRDEMAWRDLKFAPMRRSGDMVYFSGVVVGPRAGEPHDAAAFKAQTRRAFAYLDAALKAAGLTFADVVRLETFHVWNSPNFDGDKDAQFQAFAQVKDEYFKEPYPAWTALGVSELLSSAGIVEIQLTARVKPPPPPPPPKPKPKPKPRPKPAAAKPASQTGETGDAPKPAAKPKPRAPSSNNGLDIPSDDSALH